MKIASRGPFQNIGKVPQVKKYFLFSLLFVPLHEDPLPHTFTLVAASTNHQDRTILLAPKLLPPRPETALPSSGRAKSDPCVS